MSPPQHKTLPPFPDDALSGLPTHQLAQLGREPIRAEFNALFDWIKAADAAPGEYTVRDELFREKVGDRVDRLRRYVFA